MKNVVYLVVFLFITACTSQNGVKNEEDSISIKVNDTDFSKGRLGLKHDITLEDIEKFNTFKYKCSSKRTTKTRDFNT